MGYRKLMYEDSPTNTTKKLCDSLCVKSTTTFCHKICLSVVSNPPPPPPISHDHHHSKTTTFMTITIAFLAASFLIVSAYFLYAKFHNSSRQRNINTNNDNNDSLSNTRDFIDEEHGNATVDHHVWYIRTVGLDPSIIASITAVRYKKDENLIDGSDCSVCLSEFQEDESLRLLPKCSHAFHVSCIDTWLRSHTNCPMCRAPVVSVSEDEEESHVAGSESTRVEEGDFVEISLRDIERVETSTQSSVEKKKLKRLRSSCSSNSNNGNGNRNGIDSIKRSVSCNGKFVLCRPIRITDSILPLRSI